MLTMNWNDLQYRKPKRIKKKVKRKDSQLVSVNYPLSRTTFSASDWEAYEQWIKEQRKQEKVQRVKTKKKAAKSKKKNKPQKAIAKPKVEPINKDFYYKSLESPEWEKKRKEIINRDNHKCYLCASRDTLQVHHLYYCRGKRGEQLEAWKYPNDALVTLCKACHEKVHADKKHPLYPKFLS